MHQTVPPPLVPPPLPPMTIPEPNALAAPVLPAAPMPVARPTPLIPVGKTTTAEVAPPTRPATPPAPAGFIPEPTRAEAPAQGGQPATVVDRTPREPGPVSFRPVRRPPLALLCVLDDGRDEGEWVRIRVPNFVIGRTEGDLLIPHDGLMSSKHASLSRVLEINRYRWYLADLGSTNGTYLKVSSLLLKHGQEILIGSHRLRFNAAAQGTGVASKPPETDTKGWQAVSQGEMIASLIEVTQAGDGKTHYLSEPDNWIGTDPSQANVLLAGDPLVDARHAHLYRDAKNRWRLDNNKSLNGTWLRIEKVAVDGGGQFQIGEQRFVVKFA